MKLIENSIYDQWKKPQEGFLICFSSGKCNYAAFSRRALNVRLHLAGTALTERALGVPPAGDTAHGALQVPILVFREHTCTVQCFTLSFTHAHLHLQGLRNWYCELNLPSLGEVAGTQWGLRVCQVDCLEHK